MCSRLIRTWSMSSKRKNTPIKLATEEPLPPCDQVSDADSHIHSDTEDSDSDTGLALHIAARSEEEGYRPTVKVEDDYRPIVKTEADQTMMMMMEEQDMDGRPQNKKQRLLQSMQEQQLYHDNVPRAGNNHHHHNNHFIMHNNNNNMSKDSVHEFNNHKSATAVDQVLHKLSSADAAAAAAGAARPVDFMDSMVRAALGPEGSVQDKQQRLSAMISQLQNLKDSLVVSNHDMVAVNIKAEVRNILFLIHHYNITMLICF